jgi:hypothetical protein
MMSETKMHIKKKRSWLILCGVASFFMVAVATAPASLFSVFLGGDRQVAFADVSGTIWNGSIEGLSAAGVPLGDVTFKLSPFSLLTLSPRVALSAQDGAILGRGIVSVEHGNRLSLSDVNMRIDLGATAPSGVLGQPAQGTAEITIDRLRFSQKNGCGLAQGTIFTDVLNAPAQRYDLPELPLAGSLTCDGNTLVIAMTGENNRAETQMTVRILPNLTYEVTAVARSDEDDVSSALKFFGFEDQNGELTYGAAGVFKGTGT